MREEEGWGIYWRHQGVGVGLERGGWVCACGRGSRVARVQAWEGPNRKRWGHSKSEREEEGRVGGGRAGRSDIDSEMSSAAKAWAAPSLSSLPPCSSVSPAGSAAASVLLWQRGNELERRGETPALADMVGDLFFWSFCCLRLWKRDKKVRLFTAATRGCWESNGWWMWAGEEAGRQADGLKWLVEMVCRLLLQDSFHLYLVRFQTEAKAWCRTLLCFVCHF